MYKIGDNIVYGASGVMTIVDIREDSVTGDPKNYYILCEYGRANSSLTFVPMDNEKLTQAMHPVLSREEALFAVVRAGSLPDVDWVPDGRARTEKYKSILRNADRSEILAMIRTIYNTGLSRAAIGKKNFLADENVMNKAEGIIAQEFSISLGISELEVKEIINQRIKGI